MKRVVFVKVKFLMLNSTHKLFDQICSYVPWSLVPLSCPTSFHFHEKKKVKWMWMKFVYAVGTFRSTLHKISSGLCWPSRYLFCWLVCLPLCDCLIGLVVKASALRTVDPGFESCTVCTLGATLPHDWCCRVRDGTGWPSVSILWLGEVDLGFDSRFLLGDFSGSSHISDLKIGTPAATLPCAWHCRAALGLVGPVSVY